MHLPGGRNLMFVQIETLKPLTLEEHHTAIASTVLNSRVPEELRSYFATIQNVCLYAWFAYDLYALMQFLCFTAMEMALRMRLPLKGQDKRGLRNLLDEAVQKKLINAKGFSHIREMRQSAAERLRMDRQVLRQSGFWPKLSRSQAARADYAKILAAVIPSLRNTFAHPRCHAIITPGDALFQLQITSEFINQLFAAKSPR